MKIPVSPIKTENPVTEIKAENPVKHIRPENLVRPINRQNLVRPVKRSTDRHPIYGRPKPSPSDAWMIVLGLIFWPITLSLLVLKNASANRFRP
jgi:hypothetical protein